MKRICNQCQAEMIDDCSVNVELSIYGIMIKKKRKGLFNSVSAKPKAGVCKVALGKCMGNLIIAIAIIILLTAVSEIYYVAFFNFIVIAAPIFIITLVFGTIIYVNTGNRFKR